MRAIPERLSSLFTMRHYTNPHLLYLTLRWYTGTNNCLKRILDVHWQDKMTNQQLWSTAEYDQI